MLAGIAAATQPETPMLYDLQPDILQKNNTHLNGLSLDNKWIATLAGNMLLQDLNRSRSLKYEMSI